MTTKFMNADGTLTPAARAVCWTTTEDGARLLLQHATLRVDNDVLTLTTELEDGWCRATVDLDEGVDEHLADPWALAALQELTTCLPAQAANDLELVLRGVLIDAAHVQPLARRLGIQDTLLDGWLLGFENGGWYLHTPLDHGLDARLQGHRLLIINRWRRTLMVVHEVTKPQRADVVRRACLNTLRDVVVGDASSVNVGSSVSVELTSVESVNVDGVLHLAHRDQLGDVVAVHLDGEPLNGQAAWAFIMHKLVKRRSHC